MAEVVLFHHVQGLTDGVREFASSPCRSTAWTTTRSSRTRATSTPLPSYDPGATALVISRSLEFLEKLG